VRVTACIGPTVRSSVGARRAGTPDVDGGEQEQPDHVDEVPVPGGGLEAEVLLGREMTLERPHQADEQEDRADDDVRAVEARRHEEGRAIDVARVAECRMAILVDLQRGEQHAEQHGQRQTPDEAGAVVLQQRVVGPRDGGAGQQQDQRIDQRQTPRVEGAVEIVARLRRPMAARQGVALDLADDRLAERRRRAVGLDDRHGVDTGGIERGVEVGPEPGHEEHHLGGDEQDHAVAQVQTDDRRVIAAVRLTDHIPPPHEGDGGDGAEADDEQRRPLETEQAIARHGAHPDDGADGRQKGANGGQERPRAWIDQMIIVMLAVAVGHVFAPSRLPPCVYSRPPVLHSRRPSRSPAITCRPVRYRRRARRRSASACRPRGTCRKA